MNWVQVYEGDGVWPPSAVEAPTIPRWRCAVPMKNGVAAWLGKTNGGSIPLVTQQLAEVQTFGTLYGAKTACLLAKAAGVEAEPELIPR